MASEDREHDSDQEERTEENPSMYKKREDLDLPVFPGLSTSKFDCYLRCLHFLLRHGLTTVALSGLLKLLNVIFEQEVLSPSIHLFEKLFQGSFEMQFHFYCPSCFFYLRKSSDFDNHNVESPNEGCDAICKLDEKLNDGHFFIYISVEEQLRSLLESTPHVWEWLKYRFNRQVDDESVSDIFDGCLYKEYAKGGQILSQAQNVSISCNSDGSPVFKSTNNSLWPIQFRLNELPPSERFTKWNTMVAGLWFGKTEPELTTFMVPFLKESKKLCEDGFIWTDPKNERITTEVVNLNGIFDCCKAESARHQTIQRIFRVWFLLSS